jgi:uncharacterized membrane protein YfcA
VEPATSAAVLAAGVAAGAINTVVGAGTLITFPTLLALGFPPVTANVSNNIGLVFGGISGTWGYRAELGGQRAVAARLAPMSVLGAVVGAVLLLRLPAAAFEAIVPALIGLAMVLVLLQPWLAARTARRSDGRRTTVGPVLLGGTLLAGMYGGYFGAAQGVLLVGLLGSLLADDLQRVNALKNLLSLTVNACAAVTFLIVRPEAADVAVIGLIAAGSFLGGVLGAKVGRWLAPSVLRGVIVLVGAGAIYRLLAG